MKKSLFYICFALGTLLASCSQELFQEDQDGSMVENTTIEESKHGHITVRFNDEMVEMIETDLAEGGITTRSAELNNATRSLGVISMTRVFPHAGQYEKRTRAEGLHKWYSIEYDPSYATTRSAVDVFTSIPGVEHVEIESEAKANSLDIFNDPMLGQQWHYYNDGTLNEYCVAGADINVVPVWENYTTGSDKVIVAVVDGAAQADHPDLKDNLIGGKNYTQKNAPMTTHGHGTHTTGTIAAVNNNGIGGCGIAGGDAAKGEKGVRIWSAQILSNTGGAGSSSCAQAIKEGADYGAVISSNSWSIGSLSKAIMDAIDYFIKYAGCDNEGNQRPDSPMKGGVVIFSSGNEGTNTCYPAEYGPAIAVGAVGCENVVTSYSNFGDWVDICAPGGGSYGVNVLSTSPYNSYDAWFGTSMACPHVSGVAALLVSYYGGQGFTNKMLEEKLIKGANYNAGTVERQSGPLLDALGSFTYGNIPPQPVKSAEIIVSHNTVTLNFEVTSSTSESGKAFGYTVVASKNRESLSKLNYRNLPSDVVSAMEFVGNNEVGTDMFMSLNGLDHSSTYYVAIAGFDCYKTYSALSPIYEVKTEDNSAPVISTTQNNTLELWSDETVQIVYQISDPDGDEFKVKFESDSEAATCKQNLSGECILTIVGYAAEAGQHEARITATDEWGATTTYTLKYVIQI